MTMSDASVCNPLLGEEDASFNSVEKDFDNPVLSIPTYVDAWEGLRGVAVSMTCIAHVHTLSWPFEVIMGRGGIAIFFVLSGFLITGVLVNLQECSRLSQQEISTARPPRYRHLLRFYMDRSVRLYPALVAMVIVTALIRWTVSGLPDDLLYNMAATLSYLTDFTIGNSPWENTWSLAVEEQFYVFWSLALPILVCLTRKSRSWIIVLMALPSFVLGYNKFSKLFVIAPVFDRHYSPFGGVWMMLVGSLVRLSPSSVVLTHAAVAYVGMAMLATHVLLSIPEPAIDLARLGFSSDLFGSSATSELVSAFSAVLMLLGSMNGNVVLESSVCRFTGRISYALYLYQWPLLAIKQWPRGWNGYGTTAMAYILATLSTLYLEEPLRTWYKSKKRQVL